jgi:hypothetical protein
LERKRHRWAWRVGLAAAIVEAALVASVGTLAATKPPPGLLVTPVIDGKIGPREWVDASHLALPFKGHRGTLYLEHDSRFLYVLLVVHDSRLPASCCNAAVYFDKNHDGVLQPGEDAMMFRGSGVDEFWDGSSWVSDVSAGGKDDVRTAERYDAATRHVILEGRKPLCSGDRAHDFCEKPVGTVGYAVDYTSAGKGYFTYPGDPTDGSQYGILNLLPKPPPAPAPGRPTAVQVAGTVTVRETPKGTQVDATAGVAKVVSEAPGGSLQTAEVSRGQFLLTQKKGQALTLLRLSKPIRCGPGSETTVLRTLVVVANGKFRTQGAHGWTMPEGRTANWQTTDFCVPLKRYLAGEAKRKPRRHVVSCNRNRGKTNITALDPEHRPPQGVIPPGRQRCVNR